MTRKIRFGIVICLGIILISLSTSGSQAIDLKKNKVLLGGTTAGVQGAGAEVSGYDRCKKECTPEDNSCQALIKQYEELEPQINTLYDEESQIIDENVSKDKNVKKLADEVQKLFDQMSKAKSDNRESIKTKLTTKFNDLENAIGPMNPRINIISGELKKKNAALEKIDKQLSEIANKKFIKNKQEEGNKTTPADSAKPGASEEKKNDVVDVNQKSYLKHGDLVAWGIPGIPSIPVAKPSKPVHQEKTVTEKQVSDQTYQALRSVEQGSEKVTQSDVDQFLNQLNAQTAKN